MSTFNFENGLFPSSWKNADGLPWQVTTEESDGGTFSLASNNSITNRQISSCYIIGDFEAGDFDLRYMISSESNFDFGYVVVDGVAVLDHISGSVAWTTMPTHALTAGIHIIQFVYIKDNSSSSGTDAFYVDNVVLPLFTQIDNDIDYVDLSSTVFSNSSTAPAVPATITGDRNTPFYGAEAPSSGSGDTLLSYTSPADSPAGVMLFTGFANDGSGTCKLFIDSTEVQSDTGSFFTSGGGGLRAPVGHYQSVSSGSHLYEIKLSDGSDSRAYMFYEPSFASGGSIVLIPVIMNQLRNQGIN